MRRSLVTSTLCTVISLVAIPVSALPVTTTATVSGGAGHYSLSCTLTSDVSPCCGFAAAAPEKVDLAKLRDDCNKGHKSSCAALDKIAETGRYTYRGSEHRASDNERAAAISGLRDPAVLRRILDQNSKKKKIATAARVRLEELFKPELTAWDAAKKQDSFDAYETYLASFGPGYQFHKQAVARLEELDRLECSKKGSGPYRVRLAWLPLAAGPRATPDPSFVFFAKRRGRVVRMEGRPEKVVTKAEGWPDVVGASARADLESWLDSRGIVIAATPAIFRRGELVQDGVVEDKLTDEWLAAFLATHTFCFCGSRLQGLQSRMEGAVDERMDFFDRIATMLFDLNRSQAREMDAAGILPQAFLVVSAKVPPLATAQMAVATFPDADLPGIAMKGPTLNWRLSAVQRLQSQPDLVEIAAGSIDGQVAEAAVKRLDGDEPLETIARRGVSAAARTAALKRISSLDLLLSVALTGESDEAGISACERLEDSSALLRVAKEAARPAVRASATSRLTDRTMLFQLATKSPAWEVRRAAVAKLSGNAMLMNIIASEGNEEVRKTAAAQLEYSKQLPEPILWLRAQGLPIERGMTEYLNAQPKGVHAAEARDWLEYPDVLKGELSIDFSVPFPSKSGEASPAGMSIHAEGSSYKIFLMETTRVPLGWNLGGVSMIRPGKYSVRGKIAGNRITAKVIELLDK
jgi:hypothetical protein